MTTGNVRAHAIIRGRVQGVFFRGETQQAARNIGVTGWVRNKTDGTVEAVFEENPDQVSRILEWSKRGPPLSHVTAVEVRWEEFTGEFDGFRIERSDFR